MLNKSAVVLICAYWEAYCEDLAFEGVQHLVGYAKNPTALPKGLRQQVAAELRDDLNQLAVWDLADRGWRVVLTARLLNLRIARQDALNTPKSGPVDDLFRQALGIPRISDSWRWGSGSAQSNRDRLNKLVTLRGDIAHRGQAETYVRVARVREFLRHAKRLVDVTDIAVRSTVSRASSEPME